MSSVLSSGEDKPLEEQGDSRGLAEEDVSSEQPSKLGSVSSIGTWALSSVGDDKRDQNCHQVTVSSK